MNRDGCIGFDYWLEKMPLLLALTCEHELSLKLTGLKESITPPFPMILTRIVCCKNTVFVLLGLHYNQYGI